MLITSKLKNGHFISDITKVSSNNSLIKKIRGDFELMIILQKRSVGSPRVLSDCMDSIVKFLSLPIIITILAV